MTSRQEETRTRAAGSGVDIGIQIMFGAVVILAYCAALWLFRDFR
jgi:hypothetical protein